MSVWLVKMSAKSAESRKSINMGSFLFLLAFRQHNLVHASLRERRVLFSGYKLCSSGSRVLPPPPTKNVNPAPKPNAPKFSTADRKEPCGTRKNGYRSKHRVDVYSATTIHEERRTNKNQHLL